MSVATTVLTIKFDDCALGDLYPLLVDPVGYLDSGRSLSPVTVFELPEIYAADIARFVEAAQLRVVQVRLEQVALCRLPWVEAVLEWLSIVIDEVDEIEAARERELVSA